MVSVHPLCLRARCPAVQHGVLFLAYLAELLRDAALLGEIGRIHELRFEYFPASMKVLASLLEYGSG
jgi:hypothetical protein